MGARGDRIICSFIKNWYKVKNFYQIRSIGIRNYPYLAKAIEAAFNKDPSHKIGGRG